MERGWSETLRSLWTQGSMQRNSWRDRRYRKQMEVKIQNYYIVISAKANRCLRDSASDAEIRCVVWRQHAGIDGNISWLFSHLAFYETNAGLIAAGVLSSVPHQSPVWRVWSQHLQTQSGLWGDDIVPVRLAIFVSMTEMTNDICNSRCRVTKQTGATWSWPVPTSDLLWPSWSWQAWHQPTYQ